MKEHAHTGVIDLAGGAPPPGGEQLGAALGLQELQVRHLMMRHAQHERRKVMMQGCCNDDTG
jgi:hypothetical protein